MIRILAALALAFTLTAAEAHAAATDPANTLYMDLKQGRVTIQLRPDLAPNHVKRVKELATAHFYDNTPFHRVIPGFMAQGGDPTGTGSGGSGKPPLKAEFTHTNFGRGTIGAARTGDPDSADSQFFICYRDCSGLNGQYTVWGQVVDGMNLVDKIKPGDPNNDGVVGANPDRILKMRLATDPNQ